MKKIIKVEVRKNEGLVCIRYMENKQEKVIFASTFEVAAKKININYSEVEKFINKNFKKRFVAKSASDLGIESYWYDGDIEHQNWWIFDKLTTEISSDSYESNRGTIQKDIKICEEKGFMNF